MTNNLGCHIGFVFGDNTVNYEKKDSQAPPLICIISVRSSSILSTGMA